MEGHNHFSKLVCALSEAKGMETIMKLDVKSYLEEFVRNKSDIQNKEIMQFPDVTIETDDIRMVMISEVVPSDPKDYFYSRKPDAAFMGTTIPIFNESGISVNTIDDIISKGIYITTASKVPKDGYTIPTETIKNQLPILEEELNLFKNLQVIMLMGDVAKKAVNAIARKNTKKSIIPNESTYKIRGNEYYFGDIRVFPSYIITGGNILIEKSKVEMIKQDLFAARSIIEA